MFDLYHRMSYCAKEDIKELGGVWNPRQKCWQMPTEEAWNAAWKLCEFHGPNEVEDTEAHEESYRGLGAAKPIALKGQSADAVKSGQIFAGVGNDSRQMLEEWIVCCQVDHSMADAGDFACVNLRTGGMRFMSPLKIASYSWREVKIELAKKAWSQFVSKRQWQAA